MSKALAIIIAVVAIVGIAMTQGNSDGGACHDAYVHEYAFYGQPGALSEQEYCDTVDQKPIGGDYPQNP